MIENCQSHSLKKYDLFQVLMPKEIIATVLPLDRIEWIYELEREKTDPLVDFGMHLTYIGQYAEWLKDGESHTGCYSFGFLCPKEFGHPLPFVSQPFAQLTYGEIQQFGYIYISANIIKAGLKSKQLVYLGNYSNS